MLLLSGLSADQTMPCWNVKGVTASCHDRLGIYPGLSNDCPCGNYCLCIVVERTAHWPIVYVASVPARNARLRLVFVAAFAAHQWTSAVLDGRCIHKFIMPSSRTETESESADFFMQLAETDCLQDVENHNNTSIDNASPELMFIHILPEQVNK